jgi:acetyl-CoA acetyltransferase
MKSDIAIVGVGQTRPVRRADRDIRALVVEAVQLALDDAGIAPEEVDGVISDGVIMPASVPRDYLAAQFGIARRFDGGMSYGGAGSACAPMLARMAIEAGHADVVVYYFGVDWGSRESGPYGFHDIYPAKMAFEKPVGFNGQPSYFALWARRYMHEYGLTEVDLAAIATTQRESAIRNGTAQLRKPLDVAGYHASRMISDPLRAADCCLITDGAAAFVMTRMDRARDCRKRPVKVLGCGFASVPMTGDDAFTQNPDQLTMPGAREASRRALGEAGIGHDAVDFAEIYDCFTISCLMQIEDLGFCKKGEAGAFVREKGIGIDGKLPVNTHGGLLAHSYLLGAEHVVEAVRQLRGEAGAAQVRNAEVGLVSGLSVPDYGVLVLGR